MNLKLKTFQPAPQLLKLAAAIHAQADDTAARVVASDLLDSVRQSAQTRPCARCQHSVWFVTADPPLRATQVHCRLYFDRWAESGWGWCSGELDPPAHGGPGYAVDAEAPQVGRAAGTAEAEKQRPSWRERP